MYLIGFLDIETWSTKTNAIVIESGTVVVDIDQALQYHNLPDLVTLAGEAGPKVKYLHSRFKRSDQQLWGRDFDLDTFAFHVEHRGREETLEMYKDHYHSCNITLKALRDFIEPCEEIWINGLSFDPPILKSLWAQAIGTDPNDLWDFRKECDFRTIRHVAQLPKDTRGNKHRALDDCLWMIRGLREYGLRMQGLVTKEG